MSGYSALLREQRKTNSLLEQLLTVQKNLHDTPSQRANKLSAFFHSDVLHAEPSRPEDNDSWPTHVKETELKLRCYNYKGACLKLWTELEHLISHYRVVGGVAGIIEASEGLKKVLLEADPGEWLDKALTMKTKELQEFQTSVLQHFANLFKSICEFNTSLKRQKQAFCLPSVERWKGLISNDPKENGLGFMSKSDLVDFMKSPVLSNVKVLDDCLDYLSGKLYPILVSLMVGVTEELSTLTGRSAKVWLTSEKIEDFDSWKSKYLVSVFGSPHVGIGLWFYGTIEIPSDLVVRCAKHRRACYKMDNQLRSLIAHYGLVGGDKEVTKASVSVIENLYEPLRCTDNVFMLGARGQHSEIQKYLNNTISSLERLHFAVCGFQRSLYLQKHAFNFSDTEHWIELLWNSSRIMSSFVRENELNECLRYIQGYLFHSLDEAMDDVDEELKIFGNKSLPSFLADENERATTRYVNITAIATFFSSVTATTLQFSIMLGSSLGSAVNLFWFLSLVFSVSSGVSSLLGMTWRKSSIYHSNPPPKPIKFWLDYAPMIFLIIAALAFIVGLNLLAFLTSKPESDYVPRATSVFTGLHFLGLLITVVWFLLELKQKAKWFLHPHRQFKKDLHLQREIHWAFGRDKRVAQLNYDIYLLPVDCNPEPHTLSKLIRCFGDFVLMLFSWRRSKKGREQLDVEIGESDHIEETRTVAQVMQKERRFRVSLEEKFGDDRLVTQVMSLITEWEQPPIGTFAEMSRQETRLQNDLKRLLWGYPELYNAVEHELIEQGYDARSKSRTDKSRYAENVLSSERLHRMKIEGGMDLDMHVQSKVHNRRRPYPGPGMSETIPLQTTPISNLQRT